MENSTSALSKKRSTKADNRFGQDAQSPFEMICGFDERINPAIILAEELMRKDLCRAMDFADIEEAETTLQFARLEIEKVERQFAQIVKTKPQPSRQIPTGF